MNCSSNKDCKAVSPLNIPAETTVISFEVRVLVLSFVNNQLILSDIYFFDRK